MGKKHDLMDFKEKKIYLQWENPWFRFPFFSLNPLMWVCTIL